MRPELRAAMLTLKGELVSPCTTCGGTGWLVPEVPGEANPCRCMTVFHYLNALIESRIPKDYWWLNLDDLDEVDEDYKKFCRWFMKRLPKATANALGVMFLGANGIGKTSMQCAIGKEAVVMGYSVRYFTAQQYIESRKSSDDKSLTDYLERADIILLDELDKVYIANRSTFVEKTIEDFLRRSTSSGTSLIICTNYDEATLEDVFGQSTVSMLRRHLKFVNVTGGDYSEKLQSRWDVLMDSERDYFSDSILRMADRMMARELQEDLLDWEKEQ